MDDGNDASTSSIHERSFVTAFVAPPRRDRYLRLLESARGRAKFVERLAHFPDFDRRHAELILPAAQEPARIGDILRRYGAPRMCYVLSACSDLDRQQMLLTEALGMVVGSGCGTVISCVPGMLAYLELEEPGQRFVLRR
jgi:hypothetical protein